MGGEGFEGYFFYSKYKMPLICKNSKIVLIEGFGGFWRVHMTFSNSIYVVIIFLKLKIYYD